MADDPISAALAPVRERQAKATAREGDAALWIGAMGRLADEDVPRLLAAVDEVLALHNAEPWYLAASDCGHPEPEDDMSDEWQDWDDTHVTGSGGILICRETQVDSFCRECTRLNYGNEEPEGDDFVSAPCATRKAVLAALTGEGNGG